MYVMEQGSRAGPYGMLTPSSSGSTGSVDVGPQQMTEDEGSPITFAHRWGHDDQENTPLCIQGFCQRSCADQGGWRGD
jgi:hypothetical protein